MSPFLIASIFLLGLSSKAIAANFNQVFEWNEWDYEWPSEASRARALKDGTFNLENIYPIHMAVYGTRTFLSLEKHKVNIPVSLVSVPTSSASSALPKLTPVPSWDMHKLGDYSKIERARGLQVDSKGKLWVLDEGSDCTASKIWTIDLKNNDQTKIIHRFPFQRLLHELMLDETPNGTFAYISNSNVFVKQYIVVFSLQKNESWRVDPQRISFFSMALSPKDREPRELYLSKCDSGELYSIPVATLRDGTRAANPKLIGALNTRCSYRMLVDNHGTIYSAFVIKNYIYSWNTYQPFVAHRFYQVADELEAEFLPFAFAFDENGTFWMTFYNTERKPSYRLLNNAVEAKSSKALPVTPANPTTKVQNSSFLTLKLHQDRQFIIVLICSIVFTVILSGLIILCLILREKRINSLPPNTNEAHRMIIFSDELAKYHGSQNDDNFS
ncbi:protein yellow-like [Cloeon dipterum]|uniref:protein yellow-like n=1 Tax=Cloeon dipterum TaxID=197152 RepID=UPI0032209FC2